MMIISPVFWLHVRENHAKIQSDIAIASAGMADRIEKNEELREAKETKVRWKKPRPYAGRIFPLIVTALIYFAVAWLLTLLLKTLENRIDPTRRKRQIKGVTVHAD